MICWVIFSRFLSVSPFYGSGVCSSSSNFSVFIFRTTEAVPFFRLFYHGVFANHTSSSSCLRRQTGLKPAAVRQGSGERYEEATKLEAADLMRGLISEIRLHLDATAPGGHRIDLYGELGAILGLVGAQNDKTRVLRAGCRIQCLRGQDVMKNLP